MMQLAGPGVPWLNASTIPSQGLSPPSINYSEDIDRLEDLCRNISQIPPSIPGPHTSKNHRLAIFLADPEVSVGPSNEEDWEYL